MKSPLTFEIDPDKGLVVGTINSQELGPYVGRWKMGPSTSYLLTFEREGSTPVSTAGLMVGELLFTGIIRDASLIEFFNLLAENRRSGVLVAIRGNIKRSIFFKDGDIRFASSNVENERLGSILYRFGFITEEQKKEVLSVRSAKHIGELLIERNYLTPSQLYKAIKIQIQEICYSTILFKNGAFYFYELLGDVPSKIRFMARDILMEGVRRMDELSYFKTKIPSLDVVPVMVNPAWKEQENVSVHERDVLHLIDGKRSISEIARETKLGEFDTLKIIYNLMQAGFIKLKSAPRTVRSDGDKDGLSEEQRLLRRIVKVYSYVFKMLQRRIGARVDLVETVQSYLEQSGEPFGKFFASHPMGKGFTIDMDALDEFITEGDGRASLRSLERILRDAVQFVLFTAGLSLSEEVEGMLEEIGEELTYGNG